MITLTTSFMKQGMARAVPGARWDSDTGAWVVDTPTPRAAAVALKLFPHLYHEYPELAELRASLLTETRPFDMATEYVEEYADPSFVLAPRVEKLLAERGWKLFPYQRTDLIYVEAVLREHGGAYVGWERGMGKTIGTCALIDAMDAQRTLVICPNTAKTPVWAAELAQMCPWAEVHVMPNQKAKRDRLLSAIRTHRTPLILVTHYESLAVVAGKDAKGKLGRGWDKLGEWDLVVADEGHRFANPKAQMTRAAKRIPSKARLVLSGSIIQNHLEELFSPLQWLFPKTYKSAWKDWNNRFLDYVENGYGRVCVGIKPDTVEELRRELGVFMVYRRKEDELDMPARLDVDRRIELSPAQRKAYDQLRDECMTMLEDGTKVKAAEGIAMLTRLRQLATGLDLLGHEVTDSAKLDLAVEMIEDGRDDDFVVFSWYKAAVYSLRDRLAAKGIEVFCVTGDVSHEQRDDMIARFQAGEGRVFIGTLATMGESHNLQRANNAIFLDRSWNPGLNAQAEDRIYRQGQKRRVTITHIIAADTVDELNVLPTLANKQALRGAILGGTER